MAPALSQSEAQKVFERYVQENAASDAKGDTEAIATVEGGRLLEESLASRRLHQAKGTKDTPVQYTKPVFLIPRPAKGATAPQGFAVLSKSDAQENNRTSVLHYFTRDKDSGDWKAVAASWVLTEPLPEPSEPTPTSSREIVMLRPKVMPSLAQDSSGVVELSTTSTADTGVCGRYAEYLTFTVPTGKPDSPNFERGEFTSKLVEFFNGWEAKSLQRSLSFRPAGKELPVLRLKDGGSLVTCTLEGTYRDKGRTSADWIETNVGSDTEALLGGGTRKWASIEEVWSVTAVVEVPPGGSPAAVLSANAYGATKLSVKGVEWK
ncbi:hypothetical protein ACH4TC_01460 [Streptomyces spororaveus]|uniref:hypothetical protein n=1 Tax=Streptomyces spororaveus TaxID=284039 RepID=UPI0037A91586